MTKRSLAFRVLVLLIIIINSHAFGPVARASLTEGAQKQPATFTTLTAGETRSARLEIGAEDRYRITMAKDQYLEVRIEQKGVDVKVAISGPDGAQLINFDSYPGFRGEERGALIAPSSGHYQIEIAFADFGMPPGDYAITALLQPAPTDQEQLRAAAYALTYEALKLAAANNKEGQTAALARFNEALAQWRALSDRRAEFETLLFLARHYRTLGDRQKMLTTLEQAHTLTKNLADPYQEALALRALGLYYTENRQQLDRVPEICQQIIAIFNKYQDQQNVADIFNMWGMSYQFAGNFQASVEPITESLNLARQVGLKKREAICLNNLANAYAALTEYRKAVTLLQESLPLRRQLGDKKGEATSLVNLATLHRDQGEIKLTLAYLEQALTLARTAGDKVTLGATLGNIGTIKLTQGEYQQAFDYFNQALQLRREGGDKNGEAVMIGNFGLLYSNCGDYDNALKYFAQALQLFREVKNRNFEAITLNRIGSLYLKLGDYDKALAHLTPAFEIQRSLGLKRELVGTLVEIGAALQLKGDTTKSIETLTEAMTQARAISYVSGTVNALNYLGAVHYRLGELDKALSYYQQSAQANQNRYTVQQYTALTGIARIERDRGDLKQAFATITGVLDSAETDRAEVVNKDLRDSYSSGARDYYDLAIDIAIRLYQREKTPNYLQQALNLSEQGRARSLIASLNENNTNITQGVDTALKESARELQNKINAKYELVARLGNDKQKATQLATAQEELAKLVNEYNSLQAEIRRKNPRYANVTQVQPFDVDEFQKSVLDHNTLLLEYSLGPQHSYLWAVTKDSINVYELPKKDLLEKAARDYYNLLTARSRQPRFEREDARQERIAQADAQLDSAAAELSRLLLTPVAHQLGKKRLIIVPDGALHYLPFAALPKTMPTRKTKAARRQGYTPLIAAHEIINLPSAFTLMALRKETRTTATKPLIVFADPVFSNSDERIAGAKGKNVAPENALALRYVEQFSAERDSNAASELTRLINTGKEAEVIGRYAGKEAKLHLGFDAKLATALSDELKDYRIVHFGTHGIFNTAQPDLSALVLSLVDEKGESQPGFFTTNHAYNLNLSAELVVLSACQTGLGREIKGEGLVGLTRGFMYAGAKRVLVSLWSVNDASTAELMSRYYEKMLGPQKLNPAAALRAAQLSMWQQQQWRHPYFWSSFQLQGEIN